MSFITKDNTSGTTLVEALLYMSISSILLMTISLLLAQSLQARIKNHAVTEVEQQGQHAIRLITQTVRNADGIISPIIGQSGTSLVLDVFDVMNDPTIFDVSGDVLQITEGLSVPIQLHNTRTETSAFTVTNVSRTGTPGTIRIELTITHSNPEGRNEYSVTKTFYGNATIRY